MTNKPDLRKVVDNLRNDAGDAADAISNSVNRNKSKAAARVVWGIIGAVVLIAVVSLFLPAFAGGLPSTATDARTIVEAREHPRKAGCMLQIAKGHDWTWHEWDGGKHGVCQPIATEDGAEPDPVKPKPEPQDCLASTGDHDCIEATGKPHSPFGERKPWLFHPTWPKGQKGNSATAALWFKINGW